MAMEGFRWERTVYTVGVRNAKKEILEYSLLTIRKSRLLCGVIQNENRNSWFILGKLKRGLMKKTGDIAGRNETPIMYPVWLLACMVLLFTANIQAQAPSILPGGIVDGASLTAGAPVAPGSFIAIFGTNLATGTLNAGSIPLPFSLGGTSVQVNGVRAPLFAVSAGQINAQLPFETSAGSASVVVTVGSTSSAPVAVNVISSSPGLFLLPGNRSLSINYANGAVNAVNNPAASGSIIITYLTGQGMVTPPSSHRGRCIVGPCLKSHCCRQRHHRRTKCSHPGRTGSLRFGENGGRLMVVPASPIVPGDNDGGIVPVAGAVVASAAIANGIDN